MLRTDRLGSTAGTTTIFFGGCDAQEARRKTGAMRMIDFMEWMF
jgi:hypothetical protein